MFAAPFWRYLAFRLAGGAINVNHWRFDLRYDALMVGCCLALLRHDGGMRWILSGRIARSTSGGILALAAMVAGAAGLPSRAFSASLSFIGVAAFINFAVEREDGPIGCFEQWTRGMGGGLSYSLYVATVVLRTLKASMVREFSAEPCRIICGGGTQL